MVGQPQDSQAVKAWRWLPGLQFFGEIEENESGWGQNRNALKSQSAMCHVDWREESLEIRGKLVAIQDRGSEDLEETRDAAQTLDGSQDPWVLVLPLLWERESVTSLLWAFC